ncbi:hypothetical protein [Thiomicrorhabdus indica]|nr:hypothetical protein [Thiomicrorhabdus indica]
MTSTDNRLTGIEVFVLSKGANLFTSFSLFKGTERTQQGLDVKHQNTPSV